MSGTYILQSLFRPVTDTVITTGKMGFFFINCLRALKDLPLFFEELVLHTYRISFRCLVPVLAVVVPMGMIIAMQGLYILNIFSAQPLLSSLLAITMLREMTPAMAAIMLASQAGSSIAAELGAMRIREEIDAQEVMSVNPLAYLVAPRMLGLIIAAPILTTIANFVGVIGGWLIAVPIKGMNHGIFVANLLDFVQLEDIFSGVLKATIFGTVIAIVSCYRGYHASGGAAGVGRAANKAVVESIVIFLIINYFLSSAIFSVAEKMA